MTDIVFQGQILQNLPQTTSSNMTVCLYVFSESRRLFDFFSSAEHKRRHFEECN